MTRTGLEEQIIHFQREIAFLNELRTRSNCTCCDHYSTGRCRLYQSTIPADFVKTGCDKWDYNDIPF
jgi:hypothetical protein